MNKTEMKEWIDNANYESLLYKWRNAPMGDPFFQGEMGDYYELKMREKRSQISEAEHMIASKNVGWQR
jgi:DNA helicase IV